MFGSLGSGGGSGAPTARNARVLGTLTGTVYTISRLLGSSSTLSLTASTNANLSLSGLAIQATAGLGSASQKAVVREVAGDVAIEYPVTITGAAALGVLALSVSSGTAGQALTINITGASAGSTLTGDVPAGLTLDSAARTIAGTPTEVGAFTFSLIETLAGTIGSPKSTEVTITIAAVTLGALSLSASAANVGEAITINILGATAGSVITGAVPDGMTLDSAARTISGTPTVVGDYTFGLTETLAYASNSPRTSNVAVSVADLTTATLIYDTTTKQFVVTNAASFPGAAYVWQDETGAIVAGQSGSTLALANAPAGLQMQAIPDGVTASASNFALAPVDLYLRTFAFVAEDGTAAIGYDGWEQRFTSNGAVSANDLYRINGNKLTQIADQAGGTSTLFKSTGETLPLRVDFNGVLNPDGADINAKHFRQLYIDWTDPNNYIFIASQTNGYIIYRRGAGDTGPVELINQVSIYNNNRNLSFARIAGRIRAYIDGQETAPSVAAGGWDVSNVPLGGKIGIRGFGKSPWYATPQSILDNIVISATTAIQFAIGSKSFAAGALAASGTCTASVTNYDWALIDANGKVWKDWTSNVAVTGTGTWGISGAVIPGGLEGRLIYLAMRPSSNKANLLLLDCGVAPITPVISPYVHGVNEDFITDYSGMGRERNMFMHASPRIDAGTTYARDFPNEQTGLDESGQFHSYPPGGSKYDFAISQAARGKTVDITYPSSMTAAFSGLVDVTVLQGPSGGTAKIAVGANSNGTLVLSGTIPSEGVGTMNVTMYEVGETDKTSYLSEPYKTHMTAGNYRACRNMSQDLGGVPFTGLINRGSNKVGVLCPKAWGEISHLNGGTHPHICIPHLADETWIEDYAAALRDEGNLHPDVKIGVENSNEVWNYAGAYVAQYDWHMFEGCKRGYFAASGPFVPIPGLLRSLDSDAPVKNSIVDRGTSLLKQPLNPGDYVLFAKSGTGWLLVKTDIARSIGDPVPITTGSGWTLIADGAATGLALRRMYSERTELIIDIFDSVFGAAKIQPIVAWQHGGGFVSAKPILDFGNLRQKMIGRGMMMTAPYWGVAFGDVTGAFPGSNTPYANWGPTQRALINTDPTAFKNAFFAAAPAVIDAMVNSDVTYRNNLDQDLVNNGYLPGSIAKGSYEIFWENRYGTNWPDAIKTIYGEIIRDARMGALMTRQAGRTRDEIGGHQMWFTRGSRIPTNFVSDLMMYWGMAESETDIGPDNARFTALAAVGAGA